jgi:hypothetical protein
MASAAENLADQACAVDASTKGLKPAVSGRASRLGERPADGHQLLVGALREEQPEQPLPPCYRGRGAEVLSQADVLDQDIVAGALAEVRVS